MMRRRLAVVTLIVCLMLPLSLTAQDTPTPEPPSPTPLPTNTPELPTATFTELPSATPTPPTDTPLPSETPLPTATLEPSLVPTALPSPSLTPTFTLAPSETAAELPTATVTASETATLTTTPNSIDPTLLLLFTETFDDLQLDFLWQALATSFVPSESGQALRFGGSTQPVTVLYSTLNNVVVQARFQLNGTYAQLMLRDSADGNYSLTLTPDGTLTILRSGQVISSVIVADFAPGDWHTLRFSVLGASLQVTINGVVYFTFDDPAPLPLGAVNFQGGDGALLDDVMLWMPSADVPDITMWTTTPPMQAAGGVSLQGVSQLYVGAPQGGINVHSTTSMSGWWYLSHSLTVEYNDPVVGMLFNAHYTLDNPNSAFPWREISNGALYGTGMYGRSHLEQYGSPPQVCFMAYGDFGLGLQYGNTNCSLFFPESGLDVQNVGFPPAGSRGQIYQQQFQAWTARFSGATYVMGPTRFIYYGTPPTPTPTPTLTPTPTPTATPQPLSACQGTIRLSDTSGTIPVRTQPNRQGAELIRLSHNANVIVLGIYNASYYVQFSLNSADVGWINDLGAIDIASSCTNLTPVNETGIVISATYDYVVDEPPQSWLSLPCDASPTNDNRLNCVRIVFRTYWERFNALNGRSPRISEILAGVYRSELSEVIAGGITGVNSRAGISGSDLAREALRANYWFVVYNVKPECQSAECNARLTPEQLTQSYLIQFQSWYQLANYGSPNATVVQQALIIDAVNYIQIGIAAVQQRFNTNGAIIQWGNYGYGKPGYDLPVSDTRIAYCYVFRSYIDGDGDLTTAAFTTMNGDIWNDYRFVLILTQSLGVGTSTYGGQFQQDDYTLRRPAWLDQTAIQNGQAVSYRNLVGNRNYSVCS